MPANFTRRRDLFLAAGFPDPDASLAAIPAWVAVDGAGAGLRDRQRRLRVPPLAAGRRLRRRRRLARGARRLRRACREGKAARRAAAAARRFLRVARALSGLDRKRQCRLFLLEPALL